QSALSRFEARSIAVALTSRSTIRCPVLSELALPESAEQPELAEQSCAQVAEHSTSCKVCSQDLASWNTGSELFGTLETLIRARKQPGAKTEPDDADRPGRFWDKNPVLVALSAVAILIIAVASLGVPKLMGHAQVNAPVSSATSSVRSRPAPPSTSP